MKVFIGGTYSWTLDIHRMYHGKDMNEQEILENIVKPIVTGIKKEFKWRDYTDWYQHLLYYCECNNTAYIYPGGWLMSDIEFENKITNRNDISNVKCLHRM